MTNASWHWNVRVVLLTLSLLAPFAAEAQFDSRVDEIEAARQKKAAALTPEVASDAEQFLVAIKEKHILEKLTYGFHGLRPVFGGLATGQGFVVGPEYLNDDIGDGQVMFRTSARLSIREAYLIDAELAFPRLAHGAAFADILGVHHRYPQVQYYGPGPGSRKTGRSDFLLEDTSADARFGLRPLKQLQFGVTAGYVLINVGPGHRRGWTSTDQLYSPVQAPGIDQQTDYRRGGVFGQIDYRDNPRGPRKGGFYAANFTYNDDVNFDRYTFRRLDLEAQQYIGLFNQRRVIALRGKTSLSFPSPGQVVPFYMQPTLGGSEDLRGFRPYRFYDDNLIAFTAEYRYEIFSGLDMAVFADAGKVFHEHRQWNVHNMEGDLGFGFRFNARNNVFLRIDTGFSREGWQIWFKFNNVF